MAIEIERKFLVTSSEWREAEPKYYCQGYLNRDLHRMLRVRVAGHQGSLTIKGISKGAMRTEFEYSIPLEDAKALLAMTDGSNIEKYRREIEYGGLTWDVDEFLGDNEGLVVAEVELTSEDQLIELPPWVGDEVTDDARYFNANLSRTPFRTWVNE